MNRKLLLCVASLAALSAAPASAATMMYTFTQDGSTGGSLGAGPFGTVTVTETGSALDFSITLASGFRIHNTTNANHNAFAFSLVNDPNVTISNLTTGFTANNTTSGTNVSSPSLGTFFTAISCDSACGPGYNGGYSGTLSFRVTSGAGAINLSSLLANANGNLFSADIVSAANGNPTGNVGARANVAAVPEPATWAMMMLGFGGLGHATRRRKRQSLRVRFA